jgi:hypothetical protein
MMTPSMVHVTNLTPPESDNPSSRWTAVTSDGKWTAQAEHTLLITETGVDILTTSPARTAAKAKAKAAAKTEAA